MKRDLVRTSERERGKIFFGMRNVRSGRPCDRACELRPWFGVDVCVCVCVDGATSEAARRGVNILRPSLSAAARQNRDRLKTPQNKSSKTGKINCHLST